MFKITPSGVLTTLHIFCAQQNCADGGVPIGQLTVAADGNIYGFTKQGGTSNQCTFGCGTLFQITPSGLLTTLYNFCSQQNCADGYNGQALVQAADGNFYGTTAYGGICTQNPCGTAFEITPNGLLTTLYTFCSQQNCADGQFAGSLVKGTNGNFYGTTIGGGAHDNCAGNSPPGCGTIFQLTPSGALTTLYSFCGQVSQGVCPDGEGAFLTTLLQGSDGILYGTTPQGGSKYNAGTAFRITTTGALTTLYSFCPKKTSSGLCLDGSGPGALLQVTDGSFYGTTAGGGTTGGGTLFALSLSVAIAPTFSPSSLSFGNQAVNTTNTKSVIIKNINTGSATLDFTSFTTASPFTISANTCGTTLGAGAFCKVSVTFSPTVLGVAKGTLEVADNAPGSPQSVSLSGTGIAQAELTPTSYTFYRQKVGTTSPAKAFILRNDLSMSLSGISYATTGPFAVSTSTCSTTLASKSSCTISVTFSPTKTGTVTGALSVSDSANNSPQKATLSGTGD